MTRARILAGRGACTCGWVKAIHRVRQDEAGRREGHGLKMRVMWNSGSQEGSYQAHCTCSSTFPTAARASGRAAREATRTLPAWARRQAAALMHGHGHEAEALMHGCRNNGHQIMAILQHGPSKAYSQRLCVDIGGVGVALCVHALACPHGPRRDCGTTEHRHGPSGSLEYSFQSGRAARTSCSSSSRR